MPLYKSNLVCFVGSEDNKTYPNSQLIVWDDCKNVELGAIILKGIILTFRLTQHAIFIIVPTKILMFELVSLKYICTFDDMSLDIRKISIGSGYTSPKGPSILAYPSDKNKSNLKIIKIYNSGFPEYKLTNKVQMMIMTTFSEIQSVEISKKGDLLIISSRYGNKFHIYSLKDFQLKHCLFMTNEEQKIYNLTFNKKGRYIGIFSFNGNDMNLNIFDLKQKSSRDSDDEFLCQCDDYNDNEVKLISSIKRENKSHSFFGNIVSKFGNVFLKGRKSFASGKFSIKNRSSILTNHYLLEFHHIHKDCLV